jgi:hypothetical protein
MSDINLKKTDFDPQIPGFDPKMPSSNSSRMFTSMYKKTVLGVRKIEGAPKGLVIEFDPSYLRGLASLGHIEIAMYAMVDPGDEVVHGYQFITHNSMFIHPGAFSMYAGLDSPGAILGSMYFNADPKYPNCLIIYMESGLPNSLGIMFRNKHYYSDPGEYYYYHVNQGV